MINLVSNYKTLIFDCDGVVLDSNRIKTEGFRTASLPWGINAAESLVAYHVANGGISRHRKFSYFLDKILPQHAPSAVPGIDGPGLDELLATYAKAVRNGLNTCSVAKGLEDLKSQTPKSNWCIVSGGEQSELREVFSERLLDNLFDVGIYGSPDSKDEILARLLHDKKISRPALFLGDSRYDYMVSSKFNIDFAFIHGWSDVSDWKLFVNEHNLDYFQNISCLCR